MLPKTHHLKDIRDRLVGSERRQQQQRRSAGQEVTHVYAELPAAAPLLLEPRQQLLLGQLPQGLHLQGEEPQPLQPGPGTEPQPVLALQLELKLEPDNFRRFQPQALSTNERVVSRFD